MANSNPILKRRQERNYYYSQRRKGLCTQCLNPSPKFVLCFKHRMKVSIRRKYVRNSRISQNA